MTRQTLTDMTNMGLALEVELTLEDRKVLRELCAPRSALVNFLRFVKTAALQQRLSVAQGVVLNMEMAVKQAELSGAAKGMETVIAMLDEITQEEKQEDE